MPGPLYVFVGLLPEWIKADISGNASAVDELEAGAKGNVTHDILQRRVSVTPLDKALFLLEGPALTEHGHACGRITILCPDKFKAASLFHGAQSSTGQRSGLRSSGDSGG